MNQCSSMTSGDIPRSAAEGDCGTVSLSTKDLAVCGRIGRACRLLKVKARVGGTKWANDAKSS